MTDPIIARMDEDLKDLGRSIHTRRAYIQVVKRLHRYAGGPLEELGIDEVLEFTRTNIRSDRFAPNSLAVHAAAIRFLFNVTLRRPEVVRGIRTPRRRRKLPVVMTVDEVKRCIVASPNERARAFIMLAYGAGLRISEVRHLQSGDIRTRDGVIHIRCGKGRKERLVMLSGVLLRQLRVAWREQKPEGPWVFPGMRRGTPICARHIRRVWKDAQERAGLRRYYPFHALRGSFATHMLDAGTDLRSIQVLLGHAQMSTTIRYIAVQAQHVRDVASPLDRLALATR